MTSRRIPGAALAVLSVVTLVAALAVFGTDRPQARAGTYVINGPYATLLDTADDLGPSRGGRVQLTAALRAASRPVELDRWAGANGLSLRWRDGDAWAVIEGNPTSVSAAFGVAVHDYRARSGPQAGRVFYASPQQPAVPSAARAEVTGLGRILSHLPYRVAIPPTLPRDVPDGGLLPSQLLSAYNVDPLTDQGFTGKGATVVVFAFDGFDQADMDSFSELFDVPPISIEVMGGMPEQRSGEATMDLQVIHAIAPDAKLVLVNSRPTV